MTNNLVLAVCIVSTCLYAQPAMMEECYYLDCLLDFGQGDQQASLGMNAKALYPCGLVMEVCADPFKHMHPHVINDQPLTCLAGDVAASSMRCKSHICVMWSLCTCSHL